MDIKQAIHDVGEYLPEYIPQVDNTITFRLGYGRLKLWRVTDDLVWCGFILPHKHDPMIDNLLHLSPSELVALAH